MVLGQILRAKGQEVFAVEPAASLWDAACKMGELNVGSLVVCDEQGSLLGIVTERDILRAVAERRAPLATLSVADHMTRDTITATSNASLGEAMELMTERRIRHLPIVDHGELAGIVSIGDLVKAQLDQVSLEHQFMLHYIQS
jgi:CBS domain-containing protein